MKIVKVIKAEFIKNYTLKNLLTILIILLLLVVMVSEYLLLDKEYDSTEESWNYTTGRYELAKEEYQNNPNFVNEFAIHYYQSSLEINIDENWKQECSYRIWELNNKIFIINQMLENTDFSYEEDNSSDPLNYSIYENSVEKIKEEQKPLEELKEKYLEEIKVYQKLVDDSKYYKYIEYQLKNKEDSSENYYAGQVIPNEVYEKYCQMIIDQKIKSSKDYRVNNIFLRMSLYSETSILSEKEFLQSQEIMSYPNYDGYLRRNKKLVTLEKEYKEILDYSIAHQKKQDLSFAGTSLIYENYTSSKMLVNQVLNLGIVILLLVIITSGGIVSNEHIHKTDKMLLTAPISRAKVILGKFLYLVLHTYILWLFAFILIFIYAGIRLGFHDLLTAKLIFLNGRVQEVNYILYMIGQIVVSGIPLLSILSIMLFLSATTFSTVITNFVSMIISLFFSILSSAIWAIFSTFRSGIWMKIIEYTPFVYVDNELMLESGEHYLEVLGILKVNNLQGIMNSVVFISITLFLTIFFYKKRDMKH